MKADLDLICSTVCHKSDHIIRGTGSSLKTLPTLPRPVRPIFSKIGDKLKYLHFIMCHISVVPKGNDFSQESLFRSNKQDDAWCYNIFLQPDKKAVEIDFARNPAL